MTPIIGRVRWGRGLTLCSLLLVLSLTAACGDDDDDDSDPTATEAESDATATDAETEETAEVTAEATADGGAATEEASDAAPPEQTSISIGVSGGGGGVLSTVDLALEEGFYEEYGLTDVEVVPFQSSSDLATALLTGAIDVGVGAYTGLLIAAGAGEEGQAFYVQSTCPCYSIISTTYDSLEEASAAGGSIGTSSPGGLDWTVTHVLLETAGIDPSTLEFVTGLGQTEKADQILNGSIDLGSVTPPGSVKIRSSEDAQTLLEMRDVIPDFPFEVAWAATSFIEENPNTIQAVVNAIGATADWARENVDETVQFTIENEQVSPEDEEFFREGFTEYLIPSWPSAADEISLEGAEVMAQAYVDEGQITTDNLEEFVISTFNFNFTGDKQP
ncbi:MAG: hypothetical protein GEU28_05385 [Dehalococcoidia bacterium]|nr:hypothetical protein [Dehalococcoidia bacterium]